MLLSPFSNLSIHLASKQTFIPLASRNPNPPKSFSLLSASHFTIWYFLFLLVPCQNKLDLIESKA